jgi:hypothetical protein
MREQMYIPKEIVVGFQKRSDTFTGKLAYVIYKDGKGKLRKEASWNGWRNKEIEPVTIQNVPSTGFTLNKGIKRDGYWGNGRSVIRVWDPRDFEFEISVDNLIGILMHADVSKRDITEPCVFAWYGTELVLLPTNSEEYQTSVKFTDNQHKKFSSKSLVVGHTYQPKKANETVVYLGRLNQFELKHDYGTSQWVSKDKGVEHVFIGSESKQIFFKSPSAFIADVVSEEIHADFAALMDEFYSNDCSQQVVGVKLVRGKYQDGRYDTPDTVELGPNRYVELSVADQYHGMAPRVIARRVFTWDEASMMLRADGVQDKESYNRYYHRDTGISVPADVQAVLDTINAHLRASLPVPLPVTNDWRGRPHDVRYDPQALVGLVSKAINATVTVGSLKFTLADGKICKQHHYL